MSGPWGLQSTARIERLILQAARTPDRTEASVR
jgi:hypothetical protein